MVIGRHGVTLASVAIALAWTTPASTATEIDLSLASASVTGENPEDWVGAVVATAGDANGDGWADLLFAAPGADCGGVDRGAVYYFLGLPQGLTMDMSVAGATGVFVGEADGDAAGSALAGGFDVNGDGLTDMVIGAPDSDENGAAAGMVYLVFGRVWDWTQGEPLSDADASFLGEDSDDAAGYSVAMAGDMDGDGLGDLLVGAPYNGEFGMQAGQVYLILGKTSGWATGVTLDQADGSWRGETEIDFAGYAVSGAGDVDGDGLDDALVGAPCYYAGNWWGKAHLVLGQAAGWAMDIDLAGSAASFIGENIQDIAGGRLAGLGDVDGDGFDDMAIAAHFNDEWDSQAGQTYLVFGADTGWQSGVDLATVDASFLGAIDGVELGWSVASAGDLNDDGLSDVVIGGPGDRTNGSRAGAAYVVHGRQSGWAMDTVVANADIAYLGEMSGDEAGASVAPAGDVNGDGIDDLLVGAPYNDETGMDAGQVYVVFGASCAGVDADGDGWTDCAGDCDDADPALHGSDQDGDGFSPCAGDCDDADPGSYPHADEVCDGVADNDCDGESVVWDLDSDGDGWTTCLGDCSDADPSLHPDDEDGDGFSPCDDDCDDSSASIYPNAIEVCDGVDNDCDGELLTGEEDQDGDGFLACAGGADSADCDDENADVHPGATEECDGVDNDCDGVADDVDEDSDGHLASECGGDDCDDGDPDIHGGAVEICDDGVDNDCDGEADEYDECGGDDDSDDDTGDDDDPGEEPPDSVGKGCDCGVALAADGRPERVPLLSLAALFAVRGIRRLRRVGMTSPVPKDRR